MVSRVTKVTWAVDADGNWSNPSNWSDGMLPNSSNNVTISTAQVHTITHDSGNDVVNALTVGATDHFDLTGGSLEILTTAVFNDGYQQQGGSLQAGTVTIHKSGTLTGGSATGSTVLNFGAAIAIANYTLAGAAVLNNTSTTSQTAAITVGDNTGVDATINNEAGAKYQIAGDYGINGGAATAGFVNAGTLAKVAGSATSQIGINTTSTGTISAAAGGTLEFTGPNNTVGGVVSGAGQVAFGGSSDTTLTIGTIGVGTLGLYDNAALALGGNTVLNGGFTEAANFGTTRFELGTHTLTINGAVNQSGVEGAPVIEGSGALVLNGTSSIDGTLGGSVTATNNGTLLQASGFVLGDSSGSLAQIVNSAGGIYDLTQDVSLAIGANAGALLSNAGLLEKTTSTGTSTIAAVVSNAASATILVSTGTLAFSNVLTNAGTLAGSGTVELVNSASATLGTSTVLTVATLTVTDNASLTLGKSLTYGGVFTDAGSFGAGTLNIGATTFTLSGAGNSFSGFEGSATILGSGTLANTGTLSLGELTVGGSVTLDNTGIVNQVGTLTLGDSSGKTTAIVNAAGASWNLVNSGGLSDGASSVSTFDNAGTLNATPGAGATVQVSTMLTNEAHATIAIGSGTLDLTGGLSNSGTISGAELALINSSDTTLHAGTSLQVAGIDLTDNAGLTLTVNLSYAGSFVEDGDFGQANINLNGHVLTLTGPVQFIAFEGSSLISGGGTLSTTGTTNIGSVIIGGTSTLSNSGTVKATGLLQVGDNSGLAATFSNTATGIYDIQSDAGIGVGSSASSDFINAGLFEKTSGTGTSTISDKFINNGTITVTSGTVEFEAGTLINNGTINGSVSTDQFGNVFITHS